MAEEMKHYVKGCLDIRFFPIMQNMEDMERLKQHFEDQIYRMCAISFVEGLENAGLPAFEIQNGARAVEFEMKYKYHRERMKNYFK